MSNVINVDTEAFMKEEKIDRLLSKIILVKRWYFSDALESYNKQIFQGYQTSLCVVRARLINLFDELNPFLRRSLSIEEFEDLQKSVRNGNIADILDVWEFINDFLFKKGFLDILKKEVIL